MKQIGPISINSQTHQVTVNGTDVELTRGEFRLLDYLSTHPGFVYSQPVLLADVWGYAPGTESRTVAAHVKRLRAKLGPAGHMIKTIRSFGYKLLEA
jgi:two-component system phosphate regulon response regulator PhoB